MAPRLLHVQALPAPPLLTILHVLCCTATPHLMYFRSFASCSLSAATPPAMNARLGGACCAAARLACLLAMSACSRSRKEVACPSIIRRLMRLIWGLEGCSSSEWMAAHSASTILLTKRELTAPC